MEIHHSNLKSDGAKPKGPKQTVKEKFVCACVRRVHTYRFLNVCIHLFIYIYVHSLEE